MRRIKQSCDHKKIQKRNNIVMGIMMIVILTLASLGYSLMSAENEASSNVNELGLDFVRGGGLWKTEYSEQIFGFQYLPSDVGDIDTNLSLELDVYLEKPLYFVSPNEGVSEVLNNLGRYVLRYQEACLESFENECSGDLPIKNCEDNLIIFEVGNETRVYSHDNCVFIVGDSIKATDAFLYKILGIMQ